jgi:molybdate transport system ATP-binding protein
LARALVLEPRLLLLDEPLSALDLQSRRAVRGELRSLLERLPCVTLYVTHSPMEAMVFGDRVAVIERGAITQAGSRDDLLCHPKSPYVAEFVGINLFRGAVVQRSATGLARVRTPDGEISIVDPGEVGAEVFVAVNPREITLHTEPPAGSAQNTFRGTIAELVPEPPLGERLRAVLRTHPPLVAEVTRRAVAVLGLREGAPVYAAFKATGVHTYV